MSGARFKYVDLPPRIQELVDAALAKEGRVPVAGKKAGDRGQDTGVSTRKTETGGGSPAGARHRCPNKTEAAYRVEVLGRRGDVAAVHYEGLTLRMGNGHRYTPDWVVVTAGGQIECHEVKGGYALHSQQRARLAFDQARVEFPWVVWVWARKAEGGGWKVEG